MCSGKRILDHLATWTSQVFSPLAVIASSVVVEAALSSARGTWALTVGVAALLCFVLPIGIMMLALRTVTVGSVLGDRARRTQVLVGLLVWEAIVIVALWLGGAPPALVTSLTGFGAGILALSALTATLGASGHVGVMATAGGVAIASHGWIAGGLVLGLAALVAWSRLRLGEHSRREVWMSLVVCGLVAAGVSSLIDVVD